MSAKETKVYDYNTEKVRERLVDAFRGRRNEATAADLIALTGLPASQVQAELPAVSDEYGARLRVTESGEILYSFPDGMKSRYRGFGASLKRFFKGAKKVAAKIGTAVFKGWIVVMLVGYFLLFVALALFALVASVAISQGGGSSDSRSSNRRGGGLGGLWLTGRLFDSIIRIWFYSELFKSPEDRAFSRYGRGGGGGKDQRRPLHKAIFSHVFGDGDPDAAWAEAEKKAVVAFIQSNRGLISMPEFMSITGQKPAEAEIAINRYMLDFGGSPEVTEDGVLYFNFPELMKRRDSTDRTFGFSVLLKRIAGFSSNSKKADNTFRLINLANILFGGYFLYGALSVGQAWYFQTPKGAVLRGGIDFFYSITAYLFGGIMNLGDPVPLIAWGLGVVPLVFSALFYIVPFVRGRRLAARNEHAKEENLRRIVYRAIWDKPRGFRPESVPAAGPESTPKDPARETAHIVDEIAAWSGGDPSTDGTWTFDDIGRTRLGVQAVRSKVDPSRYELGNAIFDSHAPTT